MKHRITCYSANDIMKKVIDFSPSDTWIRQFLTGVKVYKSYFESDHRLFVTKLTTLTNNVARFRRQNQEKYQGTTSKPLKIIRYIYNTVIS